MDARAHISVKGVVQGVGFRAFVRDHAIELGVSGWVRNTTDGNLEAVFEGSRYKVMELVDLCRDGPRSSSVRELKVKWSEPTGEFGGFSVRF